MNGSFYCEFLSRLTVSVQRKRSVKWLNNSWALHRDNAPAIIASGHGNPTGIVVLIQKWTNLRSGEVDKSLH
jgi:hypothetical protein